MPDSPQISIPKLGFQRSSTSLCRPLASVHSTIATNALRFGSRPFLKDPSAIPRYNLASVVLFTRESRLQKVPVEPRPTVGPIHRSSAMKLKVNGETHELDVPPDMPLLWVLRDRLQLTGTKFGCGIAQCGACTVHIDGQARRACVTPAAAAEGADVRTIEGLEGIAADAVQSAWVGLDVPQCGFCQSGQIMSAVALLETVESPSPEEIEGAMTGNICRCNCYFRIRRAVGDAAAVLAEGKNSEAKNAAYEIEETNENDA